MLITDIKVFQSLVYQFWKTIGEEEEGFGNTSIRRGDHMRFHNNAVKTI